MINATKHARERYAERIKGIEKDAIKSNVAMYGNDYEKDLNKMYNNSRLIYTGRFQTHKECQYRLADDIILVMDKIDQNLITLYRVDFNFTKSINKVILQDLVEELDVKEKAWSLEKEKTEEANSELNNEKALLEMDIKAKEKELESLKDRLDALNKYMKTTNADEIVAKEAMDEIARKIVYSIDYKKAMQEIMED